MSFILSLLQQVYVISVLMKGHDLKDCGQGMRSKIGWLLLGVMVEVMPVKVLVRKSGLIFSQRMVLERLLLLGKPRLLEMMCS